MRRLLVSNLAYQGYTLYCKTPSRNVTRLGQAKAMPMSLGSGPRYSSDALRARTEESSALDGPWQPCRVKASDDYWYLIAQIKAFPHPAHCTRTDLRWELVRLLLMASPPPDAWSPLQKTGRFDSFWLRLATGNQRITERSARHCRPLSREHRRGKRSEHTIPGDQTVTAHCDGRGLVALYTLGTAGTRMATWRVGGAVDLGLKNDRRAQPSKHLRQPIATVGATVGATNTTPVTS